MNGRSELQVAPAVLVTAADPYRLEAMVTREQARRAMVPQGAVTMVAPGVWGVWVYQLRPYRPAWVRPVATAGAVVGVLAVAAGAGWLLLDALAGASLAFLLGLAVVAAVVLVLTRGSGGHGGCEITVSHRRR